MLPHTKIGTTSKSALETRVDKIRLSLVPQLLDVNSVNDEDIAVIVAAEARQSSKLADKLGPRAYLLAHDPYERKTERRVGDLNKNFLQNTIRSVESHNKRELVESAWRQHELLKKLDRGELHTAVPSEQERNYQEDHRHGHSHRQYSEESDKVVDNQRSELDDEEQRSVPFLNKKRTRTDNSEHFKKKSHDCYDQYGCFKDVNRHDNSNDKTNYDKTNKMNKCSTTRNGGSMGNKNPENGDVFCGCSSSSSISSCSSRLSSSNSADNGDDDVSRPGEDSSRRNALDHHHTYRQHHSQHTQHIQRQDPYPCSTMQTDLSPNAQRALWAERKAKAFVQASAAYSDSNTNTTTDLVNDNSRHKEPLPSGSKKVEKSNKHIKHNKHHKHHKHHKQDKHHKHHKEHKHKHKRKKDCE